MNKLTDSEIVKALEKILNYEFEENQVPTAVCTVDFIRSVYNLINELQNEICYFEDRIDEINTENNEVIDSQQAEIELLQKTKQLNEAEIERLQDRNNKCIYLSDDETTEFCVDGACPEFKTEAMIKAEAIKEFIEKFKAYIPSIDGDTTMDCVERAIKEAKKEMVGDENA